MNLKAILGNRLVIRREPAINNRVLPNPVSDTIQIPDGPDHREPHFEAIVLGVGSELSEAIKPGDRVICGAHPSQNLVGTGKVQWEGEPAELMSALDVVAIV